MHHFALVDRIYQDYQLVQYFHYFLKVRVDLEILVVLDYPLHLVNQVCRVILCYLLYLVLLFVLVFLVFQDHPVDRLDLVVFLVTRLLRFDQHFPRVPEVLMGLVLQSVLVRLDFQEHHFVQLLQRYPEFQLVPVDLDFLESPLNRDHLYRLVSRLLAWDRDFHSVQVVLVFQDYLQLREILVDQPTLMVQLVQLGRWLLELQ